MAHERGRGIEHGVGPTMRLGVMLGAVGDGCNVVEESHDAVEGRNVVDEGCNPVDDGCCWE